MSRIAYVNGRYLPQAAARVSIEDRGYQFADGVYEVMEVHRGGLIDEALHFARLTRSLGELKMRAPLAGEALALVAREIVRRNHIADGMVYLQVTRGVAPRDHAFPDPEPRPALVVTARAADPVKAAAKAEAGMKVITLPDLRWKRPDIKSISLLPNVLAKAEAKARGAGEAWLYDEAGLIHEGAASNAWIVGAEGQLVTHAPDGSILEGVTRTTLLALIAAMGAAAGGARLHPRRGLAGARGIHDGRDDAGDAGGGDRRQADRRRSSGAGRAGAPAPFPRCRATVAASLRPAVQDSAVVMTRNLPLMLTPIFCSALRMKHDTMQASRPYSMAPSPFSSIANCLRRVMAR